MDPKTARVKTNSLYLSEKNGRNKKGRKLSIWVLGFDWSRFGSSLGGRGGGGGLDCLRGGVVCDFVENDMAEYIWIFFKKQKWNLVTPWIVPTSLASPVMLGEIACIHPLMTWIICQSRVGRHHLFVTWRSPFLKRKCIGYGFLASHSNSMCHPRPWWRSDHWCYHQG